MHTHTLKCTFQCVKSCENLISYVQQHTAIELWFLYHSISVWHPINLLHIEYIHQFQKMVQFATPAIQMENIYCYLFLTFFFLCERVGFTQLFYFVSSLYHARTHAITHRHIVNVCAQYGSIPLRCIWVFVIRYVNNFMCFFIDGAERADVVVNACFC